MADPEHEHVRPVEDTTRVQVTWAAVVLALIAALGYILIALDVLAVNLPADDAPAAIPYVAAACYALGGLLILLGVRWLLVFGAVMNVLVMLMFFTAYANRPEVMFSPGGLLTKAAQILLEVGLIYLILTTRGRSRRTQLPA